MLITDGKRFAGIAAMAAALLAGPMSSTRTPSLRSRHRYMGSTGRKLRDPSNPHQAARIQAATEKRDRKGVKLMRDTSSATMNNFAHAGSGPNLNPFFIAR